MTRHLAAASVVVAVLGVLPALASADLVYLMAPSPLDADAPLGPSWTMVGHAFDSADACSRAHAARVSEAEAVAAQAYARAEPAVRTRVESLTYLSPYGRETALREDREMAALAVMLAWPAQVRRWVCVGAYDPRLR